VVAHCLGLEPDDVDARCESLSNEHRFLRYVGTAGWPDGTIQTGYGFAHALYRHAALARLASPTVRRFHRAIADRLQTGYGGSEDAVAAELAGHFDEGKAPGEALRFYALAIGRAVRVHGHVEAIAHFERTLTLLPLRPAGSERDAVELQILDALGPSLIAVRAASGPELVPLFERAAELARTRADDRRLYAALFALQRFRMVKGRLREVKEHAPQIAEVVARLPDPRLGTGAALVQATASVFRGGYAEAREEFARLAAALDPEPDELASLVPLHRAHAALLAWLTGRPDEALRLARRAVSSAESTRDPYLLVHTLCSLSLVHAWRGEARDTLDTSRRAMELVIGAGVSFWNTRARLLGAWAGSELDGREREPRLAELLGQPFDLDGARRTLDTPLFVELLARANHRERALDEIAAALEFARQTDERAGEPELLRLRGELLKDSAPEEADRCFKGARTLAKEQGAVSFELRAAMSLCGFRRGSQRRPAVAELRRVAATFTEGRATADLLAAKAMLAE
jgi:tetratricopeptide (TPR) repeat protein